MKRFLRKALALLTVLCLSLPLLPGAMAAPAEELSDIGRWLDCPDRLSELGYSQEEMEVLYAALSPAVLLQVTQLPYSVRLADYVALDYFREGLLERYLAYGRRYSSLSAEDVVTYVNIGLDRAGYSQVEPAADPGAVDVLVNKYHFLDSQFVPELVQMDPAYTKLTADYMEPTAYAWFVRMADAAQEEGLSLRSISAYRSYSTQHTLYNRYAARDGALIAQRYSALPGYSEHQTGLALDINVAGSSYHFEQGEEYRWLMEHCWEYGFIPRYPQNASSITGFIFEPWHYRYVGVELAAQIRESGLTYDEFVARQSVERAPAASLTILLDGQILSPKPAPIRLGEHWYLSAGSVTQALGWPSSLEGETLIVSAPWGDLSLSPQDERLRFSAAVRDGQLFLELTDLAGALGLALWELEDSAVLSTRPAAEGWPFTDVFPYDNCYDEVCYVWQNGLFSGTSEHSFSPDEPMTRGMAVTVLRKLDPSPTLNTASFPDVSAGAWYAPGVAWAYASGLAAGYSDGTFRPNEPISREQAALLLYQFTRHMGRVVCYTFLPREVSDAGQISPWAKQAVSWCLWEGLLSLREDGAADSHAPITRAEMAAALAQLCRSIL